MDVGFPTGGRSPFLPLYSADMTRFLGVDFMMVKTSKTQVRRILKFANFREASFGLYSEPSPWSEGVVEHWSHGTEWTNMGIILISATSTPILQHSIRGAGPYVLSLNLLKYQGEAFPSYDSRVRKQKVWIETILDSHSALE